MKCIAVDKEEYFSLAIDETEPGRFFIEFPVSNPMVDYSEWYEIDEATFEKYRNDLKSALPFVNECKNHLHDELLLLKPGSMRGEPWWGPSSGKR